MGCTELIGQSKYDQKCMKVQSKHGKVIQNMHGASRNYRYVWDVSPSQRLWGCLDASPGLPYQYFGVDQEHRYSFGLRPNFLRYANFLMR